MSAGDGEGSASGCYVIAVIPGLVGLSAVLGYSADDLWAPWDDPFHLLRALGYLLIAVSLAAIVSVRWIRQRRYSSYTRRPHPEVSNAHRDPRDRRRKRKASRAGRRASRQHR